MRKWGVPVSRNMYTAAGDGPSGAEKAYKAALRKLKRDLHGGAYGRWLSAQKAIHAAKAEAEQTRDITQRRRELGGKKEN